MNKIVKALLLVVGAVLVTAACGGSDEAASQPEPGQGDPIEGERIETLWVGPQLADCVGAFPQTCLQVRFSEAGQVEWFYDQIDGFEHVAGTSYVLTVGVSDVENPPADASSLSYRLIEIVESSNDAAAIGLDGTEWTLLGFRDGDLFDPVLEAGQITLKFDGATANGSSGCNTYSRSYTADGDAIVLGPLIGTLMGCDAAVMAQEQRFLSVLETVESAEVTFDERLVLKPASGLTLVFVQAG